MTPKSGERRKRVVKKRENGYRFLERILPFMNEKCAWCGKKLDINNLKLHIKSMKETGRSAPGMRRKKIDVTIDHKVPVTQGGTNDIENIQLMHKGCNNERGDRKFTGFFSN